MAVNDQFETWDGITALLQSYCSAVDLRDADRLAQLFTADAVLDLAPALQVHGPKAIAAGAQAMFEQGIATSHHIGTPQITRAAEGVYHVTTYVIVANRPLEGQGYTTYGRYEDDIRAVKGRFLIKRRKLYAHVQDGDGPDRH